MQAKQARGLSFADIDAILSEARDEPLGTKEQTRAAISEPTWRVLQRSYYGKAGVIERN